MFGVFVNSVLPPCLNIFHRPLDGTKEYLSTIRHFLFVGQIAVPAIIFSILLSH